MHIARILKIKSATMVDSVDCFGPMYSVPATDPAQYHVTGCPAEMPPPMDTWFIPELLLFVSAVALYSSALFK